MPDWMQLFRHRSKRHILILYKYKQTKIRCVRKVFFTQLFEADRENAYPSGFSYGCEEIAEGNKSVRLEEIMQRADDNMYQQKKLRKREYAGILQRKNGHL